MESGSTHPDRVERFIPERERIFSLETELRRQKQRLEDLGAMGAIIASILEIDKVQTVMMELALREVGGEVGGILLEEAGELRCSIAWGVDRGLFDQIQLPDGRTLVEAYRAGSGRQCLNRADLAPGAGVRINNLLAAPIRSRERQHGLLVIVNHDRGGEFTAEDLETLDSLNNFLAVAIENAQLVRETLDKQRMQQELMIAREVQETILPGETTQFPGYQIGALYAAANEVGGDFYEVIDTGECGFVVVIGDVSNKGVGAALVMSACSGIIKSRLRSAPGISMSALAAHLNDTLSEGVIKDRAMFATIWFGRFGANSELSYCNAGHVPPVLCRSEGAACEELSLGGPIVGQFPGVAFAEGRVELGVGDTITLYTDGITEAESEAGELFGRERAQRFVRDTFANDPQAFCRMLKAQVEEFSRGGSDESHDDFTALQVRVCAAGATSDGESV